MASTGDMTVRARADTAPSAREFLLSTLGPARVRLGTLNNLRWLAVVGQTVALLIVSLVLGFDFPLLETAIVITASALLNVG